MAKKQRTDFTIDRINSLMDMYKSNDQSDIGLAIDIIETINLGELSLEKIKIMYDAVSSEGMTVANIINGKRERAPDNRFHRLLNIIAEIKSRYKTKLEKTLKECKKGGKKLIHIYQRAKTLKDILELEDNIQLCGSYHTQYKELKNKLEYLKNKVEKQKA